MMIIGGHVTALGYASDWLLDLGSEQNIQWPVDEFRAPLRRSLEIVVFYQL